MAVRQKHIFTRNKPLVNIYGGLDNDGKQIEVREDAEQLVKYHEIVELLVGAGYYRAQLQGLTPFDKIVGGMTWCIEICDIDVHVDLLFEEDLTIGKKIALTEKIVAVLPSMKCPHIIEPHQIQGLDFINIYPLIQWLIKYSDEFREAKADELMRFAVAQFDNTFIFESDRDRVKKQQKISNNITAVMDMHKPRRERKRTVAMPKSELEQVLLTLSEYGQGMTMPSVRDTADDKRDRDDSMELLHDLQKSLADLSHFTTLANKIENDQIELTDQDLSDRKIHYAILESELTGEVSTALQESVRQKYCTEIDNLKKNLEVKRDQWQILKKDLLVETEELEKSLAEKKKQSLHFKACLQKIHNTKDDSNFEKDMKEIQAAVSRINKEKLDLLYKIEEKSKEFNCLQEAISNLETRQENKEDEILNPEERAAFDEKDNKIGAYLAEQRLRLAKVNQEVLALTSAIDDVPAPIELLQYEKRFLELYDQVAAKHKETKQFYTLYNTLFDVKLYVSKELSLLNSILDNYNEAMSSAKKREQFMSQLESIVEWVQQAKSKVERKWGEAREQRERIQRELGALQDVRRECSATLQQLAEQRRKFKELTHQ